MRRRRFLTGTTAVGALLAGCTSGRSEGSGNDTTDKNTTDETASTKKEPVSTTVETTASTTDSSTPYEVTVKPAGSYTFEKIPETYATIPGAWMDMAMGFGLQPKAVAAFDRIPLKYYEALPGVEFNADTVQTLGESAESQYDKEVFYAVDADVHLMDPRILKKYSGWDNTDLKEIETNIGPILGSMIRFPFNGHDPYYTLYEAFEKAAQIFQRHDQYDAWVDLKKSFYANIKSRIPVSGKDTPTVAAFNFGFEPESGKFYAADIYAPRNDTRSFRLLDVNSAFEGKKYVPFQPIGYEELLEVDPDYLGVIGFLSYSSGEEFQQTIEAAQNHNILSQLTAVKKGNIVRTGGQYMGPVVDLFSAEALAKQMYPNEYGAWPGSIKKIPTDEQLFDRKRVADIIHGDL